MDGDPHPEPRILVFDVETDCVAPPGSGRAHVTVAVARWMRDEGGEKGCTCIVPSAGEDASLREELAPLLDAADVVVAYNGRAFDMEVLRASHFRDEPERVAAWCAKLVDPFEVMRVASGSWVKLDELLAANGLPCKTGSGLDAVRWWAEGRREEVARYCEADVECLRSLLALRRPLALPIKRWQQHTEQERAALKDCGGGNTAGRQRYTAYLGSLDWNAYLARWWSRRITS